jgi:magnesium-protoporphyrin O-methyltransferase
VVGVDLSPKLIRVARQSAKIAGVDRLIRFESGDMRQLDLGRFDYVVAMDALIHYRAPDIADVLADFAERAERSILFTFAPRTALLATMHAVGQMFPRADRAPAIEPVGEQTMRRAILRHHGLRGFGPARTQRVNNGFYISQAMELKAK